MPLHVTLERRDGAYVIVKDASDGEGRDRLRREHEALARLSLPCMIREADWLDDASICRLATVFVDGAISVGELPGSLDIASTIAVVAAIASAVAQLHAHDIAHGAIAADHVLMAPDGTIVLCSFGASTRATVDAVERDTAALTTLLYDLCSENPTGEAGAARVVRSRLHALLRSARLPGQTAADLHDALMELEAEVLAYLGADDPEAEPPDHEPRRRLQPGGGRDTPPVLQRAGSAPDGTRTWHRRVVAAHAVDEPVPVGPRRAIVAGAVVLACLCSSWSLTRAVASGHRTVLDDVAGIEHEGEWFTTGDPDDLIAIADWRCDGTPAPLVYRPSTGEVFVFSAGPSSGARSERTDSERTSSERTSSDALPDRLVVAPGALAVDRTAECGQVLLGFPWGSRVFPLGKFR